MPIISWTQNLSVGIEALDDQHRRLISLINDLYDAMKSGHGKDALGAILKDLIHYTQTHFADEERRMAAAGYPGLAEHVREHEDLTNKVLEFQRDYEAGKITITVKLMDFLRNWLTNHIQKTDKLYTQALQ